MFNAAMTIEEILNKVYEDPMASRAEIRELLLTEDLASIKSLFLFADKVRREFMGDGVLLRGIVEFSNHCSNSCFYCGLNKDNAGIERYRMSSDEILRAAGKIKAANIKTVVLQSGEDRDLDPVWLADLVSEIKKRYSLAITLSVGERPRDDYRLWHDAGADRYLLKVETANHAIYSAAHSGRQLASRLRCLEDLREIGYQTGSGILIGLRHQTVDSIVEDILYHKEKEFDMIGIGPFIPHGGTGFANDAAGDVKLTLRALAVTRIVTKDAHMPATTAIGSLGGDHRVDALKAGANVLMPNFTPLKYKKLYEIYPGKACVTERVSSCISCMEKKAGSVNRFVDYSAGHSLKKNRIFNKEEAIYE